MKATIVRTCVFLLMPALALASGGSEKARVDTFSYEGVGRVEVQNAEIYSIAVTGVPGSELNAEVRAPEHTRVGIEHRRVGGTVFIRAYRKGGFLWFGGSGGPHNLVLRIPDSAELDLRTNTGSIEVAQVEGTKYLETDTGRIDLRGSSGDAETKTNTGSHTYTDMVGDLVARSGTGSIHLVNVRGTMDLGTKTGSIEGREVFLTHDSSFSTNTGSIRLELDQRTARMGFDLRTDTGSLSVDDLTARGKLVTGEGSPQVRAETDTGSIHIQGI
jgi:hypothetical protein